MQPKGRRGGRDCKKQKTKRSVDSAPSPCHRRRRPCARRRRRRGQLARVTREGNAAGKGPRGKRRDAGGGGAGGGDQCRHKHRRRVDGWPDRRARGWGGEQGHPLCTGAGGPRRGGRGETRPPLASAAAATRPAGNTPAAGVDRRRDARGGCAWLGRGAAGVCGLVEGRRVGGGAGEEGRGSWRLPPRAWRVEAGERRPRGRPAAATRGGREGRTRNARSLVERAGRGG